MLIPALKHMKMESVFCENADNIVYQCDATIADDGYCLHIYNDHIKVAYSDEDGKYYGLQTLAYLTSHDMLQCGVIEDYPKFAHRGVQLDVARYFLSIEELKHFITLMSNLKLNVLHLHLNDEQGWRIAIDKFPKLTEIGSIRPYSDYGRYVDSNPHQGYYTKAQLKDVIEFANQHHVHILPEINSPGHCSAILAAYPELSCDSSPVKVKTRGGVYKEILCAGNEQVYQFLYDVLDEICELFPYEYVHIGADEAQKDHWRTCLKCREKMKQENLQTIAQLQDYFINKIACYVISKGKKPIIYSDGLRIHHQSQNVDVQYWVGDKEETKKLLAKGQKMIVSTHGKYYFDLSYGQTPLRMVYNYDPCEGFMAYADQILGVEGMLWGEFMPNYKVRLYQGFPRLLALSQTAWNGTQKPDYQQFLKDCDEFLKEYKIECAPKKLWDMSKGKRIIDILRFYYKTMTRQDIKQFIATLKNERKEQEENENTFRNKAD